MNPPIPADVWQRILAFLGNKQTGQIVLDVKEGQVQAWKVTEAGRVHTAVVDRRE